MEYLLLIILVVLSAMSGVYSEVAYGTKINLKPIREMVAPGTVDVFGVKNRLKPVRETVTTNAKNQYGLRILKPDKNTVAPSSNDVYGIKTSLKPVMGISTPDHEHLQLGKPGTAVYGAYSFTTPEGYKFVFTYIADHLGFRVKGPGIPTDTEGASANGYQTLQQLNLI